MKLRYHYDKDLLYALYRYRAQQYVNALEDELRGLGMPPVDIKKLTENMQRANTLIGKAVAASERGATILDQFEQHLAGSEAHFDSIKAYDEQLAAMQQFMGNGGPPLDDKSTAATPPAPGTVSNVVGSSIDHATGDPKRT